MRPSLWMMGLCAWATLATPLLAQPAGDGGGRQETSFFRMFFIIDDLLGQMVVLFLLLLSAFSIAFVIKLFIDFRRSAVLPQALFEQISEMVANKQYREAIDLANDDSTYLAKLVSGGMNEASNGYQAMERSVEEVSDAETSRMLRPVEYLNVIGNIAPMMGLFGTVYGMIVAFQKLVDAAGRPEPQELAAGISTALVTTFWGLIVAMPALAGYALVRNKIDALTADGLIMAEELIRPFRPKRSGSGGSEPPPSSPRPRATPKPQGE